MQSLFSKTMFEISTFSFKHFFYHKKGSHPSACHDRKLIVNIKEMLRFFPMKGIYQIITSIWQNLFNIQIFVKKNNNNNYSIFLYTNVYGKF